METYYLNIVEMIYDPNGNNLQEIFQKEQDPLKMLSLKIIEKFEDSLINKCQPNEEEKRIMNEFIELIFGSLEKYKEIVKDINQRFQIFEKDKAERIYVIFDIESEKVIDMVKTNSEVEEALRKMKKYVVVRKSSLVSFNKCD